jgi:hypothetical protein
LVRLLLLMVVVVVVMMVVVSWLAAVETSTLGPRRLEVYV